VWNVLDLFSNFKWVRAPGCFSEPGGRMAVFSGPSGESSAGDAEAVHMCNKGFGGLVFQWFFV